jgi:large subunit ribosomal protein L4
METTIYNAEGKKAGSISLPESIFGLPWNASLMHQVVTSMQDNARTRVAHAKGRGEVRGGGKKPWQQKGTGRARVGSSRSPIWKGGGVTHGPIKDKVFGREIPKKMRAKALMLALSRKFRDGQIVFVDSFALEIPKTAAAKKSLLALSKIKGLERLTTKSRNAALVAFADPTIASEKSFRNIGNVACISVRNLNPLAVLGSTYLVIENPEAALAIIENRTKTQKLSSIKLAAKN